MDGYVNRKLGPIGIVGVLWDCEEKSLFIFSFSVAQFDSNAAKFLAMEKALSIPFNKRYVWRSCVGIILEPNSKILVSWVTSAENCPWKLKNVQIYFN